MRSQLSFEPHPFIRPPSRSRVYLCPFRPPFVEENGNQEMLRGLLKHTKIRILYGYIVYKY